MKIKYFDRAIEWLFFALMFLTPVIFDRRIGIVFSGTKSATIRLFLLLIITIWCIKLLTGGKHVFHRTPLDWPILTYLLSATAATVLAVHPIMSFCGFYGRYEGLITWYSYALLFFIAANYLRGFGKLKQFAALILPTAASMAVYGIIQRHGADPYMWGGVVTWQRVIGTIGQPNFLSAYMDMSFFVAMFFFLSGKNERKPAPDWSKLLSDLLPVAYYAATPLLFMLMIYSQSGMNVLLWYAFFAAMSATALLFAYNYKTLPDPAIKLIAGISMTLIYICNFYTQSRGGYLGIAVALVLLFVLLPRKRILESWKELCLLALAIVIVSGITIINPENSPFARFTSEIKIGNQEEAAQNTVELGGAAGSRGETWKSAFGIIADNPLFGIGPEDLKMVFPRYETDLFRFKEAFHVKQDRCHNETFDVPVTKGLITFFIYIYILFAVYRFGIKKLKSVPEDKKIMLAAVLAAITSYLIQNQFSFGVIAITSLFWVLWAMIVNIDTEAAAEEEKEIKFEDIPWLYAGIAVVLFLILGWIGILQFEGDKYFKTGKTIMEARRFQEALPYFKDSLRYFPFEGGTVTHYGITLLNNSNLPEALAAFSYGMKVDPYNADNLYISSRIFLMQGDAAKAVDYAYKSLRIDPYYAEAYLTLANIFERSGKGLEAQKCYNEAFRINPNLGESKIRVAKEYLQEGNYDAAFLLLQEMLVTDPQNPEVHMALSTIYAKRGDSARAREELEYAKMLLKK